MSILKKYIRKIVELDRASDDIFEYIFQKIRDFKLNGAPDPGFDIEKIATAINLEKDYETPRSAFYPIKYTNFDDWFLRDLTDETLNKCIQNAKKTNFCSPVQGTVRKKVPSGELTLKQSVVEVSHLLDLLECKDFIQISLRKNDYHHVHSPVDGIIKDVHVYNSDELFDGSESMTIFDILTSFGVVKVLCIGEWTVQTFISDVQKGDILNKMDKLGHFYFGSQVIVAIDCESEFILDRDEEPRVFPGDPIGLLPIMQEKKRIARKKGQHRNSSKHSDLFTDENPKGTIKGLKFATVKDAEASVNKIKKSGRSHAHKTQAAIAMEQRAKSMGKKSAAAVYRSFINQQKKKKDKK